MRRLICGIVAEIAKVAHRSRNPHLTGRWYGDC
jgi:hypothetical protein